LIGVQFVSQITFGNKLLGNGKSTITYDADALLPTKGSVETWQYGKANNDIREHLTRFRQLRMCSLRCFSASWLKVARLPLRTLALPRVLKFSGDRLQIKLR
jgi:hypothetical protein